MLRLAADENSNNDIVRGLLRRKPEVITVSGTSKIEKYWRTDP